VYSVAVGRLQYTEDEVGNRSIATTPYFAQKRRHITASGEVFVGWITLLLRSIDREKTKQLNSNNYLYFYPVY
jgi:hypothetical protein